MSRAVAGTAKAMVDSMVSHYRTTNYGHQRKILRLAGMAVLSHGGMDVGSVPVDRHGPSAMVREFWLKVGWTRSRHGNVSKGQ